MADRANVRSIDAISEFRARFIRYLDTARVSLGEAHSDVLRVQRWVDETQKHHWGMRHKKCRQQLANARSDLERAKIARPDAHPSMFSDQQRALAKAKLQIEACEEKLRSIQRWSRELDRQGMIFKGHLNRLDRMLDGDMTRASAWMAAMIEHLEAYTTGAAPVLPEPEQDSDDLSPRRRGRTVLDDELKEQGDEHEPAIGQDETPESDA